MIAGLKPPLRRQDRGPTGWRLLSVEPMLLGMSHARYRVRPAEYWTIHRTSPKLTALIALKNWT